MDVVRLAKSLLSIISLLYFPILVYTNFNILVIIAATAALVVLLVINVRFNKNHKL